MFKVRSSFFGYHSDLLGSLILAVTYQQKNISNLFPSRNQNLNDQSIGNEKDISYTTTSNNINTPDQLVQQQSEEEEERIFQV